MTEINFQILKNSFQIDDILLLKKLLSLKNLYTQLFPKMLKQYIVKLLFDTYHQSLVYKFGSKILAGVTFKSFPNQNFYQMPFFGVSLQSQSQGLGKKLMKKFKKICQQRRIKYILTYADNRAVGFFKKNGFTSKISIPKAQYKNYIKQYRDGTLMQFQIHETFDYENIQHNISKVLNQLFEKVQKLSSNLNQYHLLSISQLIKCKLSQNMNIYDVIQLIPGVKQAGYEKDEYIKEIDNLKEKNMKNCQRFIQKISNSLYLINTGIDSDDPDDQLDTLSEKQRKMKHLLFYIERKLANVEFDDINSFKEEFLEKFYEIFGSQKKFNEQQKKFQKKTLQFLMELNQKQIPDVHSIEKQKIQETDSQITKQ